MIHVVLPQGLRTLAGVGREVQVEVNGAVTQRTVLDALEAAHPVLRGTIRDHQSQLRRPFIRFFACEQDLSHESPDEPLPEPVAQGREPFLVVGAIAGGSTPVESTASTMGPGDSAVPMYQLLLSGGLLAGPFYLLVAGIQAFTRDGFDITRHPVSLLSNGDLGWVQILNFGITGCLVIAAAIGLRAMVTEGRGAIAGPILLGVYGIGLIASGIFVADPADGFPPGTPTGDPETVTFAGIMHFMAGGIGFAGLIAACIVFFRRFVAKRMQRFAWFSLITGLFFLVSFGLTAAIPGEAVSNIMLTAAATVSWIWLALISWWAFRNSSQRNETDRHRLSEGNIAE